MTPRDFRHDKNCIAPDSIKKLITGNGRAKKAKKAEVARGLVLKFPEARVLLTQAPA